MTKARDLASGIPVPSTVSATELGYVDGVTSAIQTQIDSKLGTSTAASTYQTIAQNGLIKIIPSSVAVGSGTGSADATGKVTFSGASSVSLNNVFSSTYTSYKIVINAYSSRQQLFFRFRNAGTDDTSSNYYNASYYIYMGTGGTSNNIIKGSAVSAWDWRVMPTSNGGFITADVNNPQVAAKKNAFFNTNFMESTSDAYYENGGNIFNSTNTFDGFTIYPGAATMTGTVSVYGYN